MAILWPPPQCTCNTEGMATYTTIPKADHTGFDVAVKGVDGVRQTMLGFPTEEDARTWIKLDQKRDAADRHGDPKLRWAGASGGAAWASAQVARSSG